MSVGSALAKVPQQGLLTTESAMQAKSEAVFFQRLAELNLHGLEDKFKEAGWTAYGIFAFAVPSSHNGMLDEAAFKTNVLRRLHPDLGAEAPEPPDAAALRRLWYESHVISISELRAAVNQPDPDSPCRLPRAEQTARKKALRKRLAPGVIVEGLLDPGESIVTAFITMFENNSVSWLPWENCPTAKQESKPGEPKRQRTTDIDGTVRDKIVRKIPLADVSDTMLISLAMQRRGIGAEVAGVMSFEVHELLRTRLMIALTTKSHDKGHVSPGISRVREADQKCWELLQDKCEGGVRPLPGDGKLPLDVALPEVLKDFEFVTKLLPLAKADHSGAEHKSKKVSSSFSGSSSSSNQKKKRTRKRKARRAAQKTDKEKIKQTEKELAELRNRMKHVSSKGKGKGKGKTFMPTDLRPGRPRTDDNVPICFNYNRGVCNAVPAGGSCSNGKHVCCRIGCTATHAALPSSCRVGC